MAKKPARARTAKKSSISKEKSAALRRFIRARGAEYLRDPNVTSIGVGLKNGDGKVAIVFSVAAKKDDEKLPAMGTVRLPDTIAVEGVDYPTDVIQRSYRPSFDIVAPDGPNIRKSRLDPILPGISVANVRGDAGTLGMIVFDAVDGTPCILSNWHILHGPTGVIGDAIAQPGPRDNNNTAGNGCGTLLRSHLGPSGDCALARVQGRGLRRELHGLNVVPKRLGNVELGDRVVKSGRSTGITYGIVRRHDVIVSVNYGGAIGAKDIGGFEIGVDPQRPPADGEISKSGDSGSIWMIANGDKATDIIAGLHFGGEIDGNDDEHALACYPLSVQRKLNFALEPPAPLVMEAEEEDDGLARTGFDPDFLGIPAPMPELSLSLKRDATNFGRAQTIPYTHFSVCQSSKRRLPRFVAWNIDGARRVVLPVHGFKLDERIDAGDQAGDPLYETNNLERRQIALGSDLAWGEVEEAKQSNLDSFFYTNALPRHDRFGESYRGGMWDGLENLVLGHGGAQDIRVSVLGGPIFAEADPEYRGIRLPTQFWKLIAYRAADGDLTSAAFLLSQSDLVDEIESLDSDPLRLYQVSLSVLADRTGLGFDAYAGSNVLEAPARAMQDAIATEGLERGDGMREVLDVWNIAF